MACCVMYAALAAGLVAWIGWLTRRPHDPAIRWSLSEHPPKGGP